MLRPLRPSGGNRDGAASEVAHVRRPGSRAVRNVRRHLPRMPAPIDGGFTLSGGARRCAGSRSLGPSTLRGLALEVDRPQRFPYRSRVSLGHAGPPRAGTGHLDRLGVVRLASSATGPLLGTAVDEAASAASAAPSAQRRWPGEARQDRGRDRFTSPACLTHLGARSASCLDNRAFRHMTDLRDVPCGPTLRSDSARGESHFPSPGISPWRPETPRALVCASTFSRAAQPYRLCSAAFPAATRRAPSGESRGPSRPTSPLTRAGRFPCGQGSFGTWRASCRALLPTLSGDPTAREPVRFAVVSPRNRDSKRFPVLEGWATSTFSRAERPYRRCSAAPHFAPGAFLGSRAGCPASTTPLTRAGQPPRRTQRGAVVDSCGAAAPPQRRRPRVPARLRHEHADLARAHPGIKADEARLLGGGGDGLHRCPRPGSSPAVRLGLRAAFEEGM